MHLFFWNIFEPFTIAEKLRGMSYKIYTSIHWIWFLYLRVHYIRSNPMEKLAEGSRGILYNDEALHIYRNICLYSILDREHPSSTLFFATHLCTTVPTLTHSITSIGNAGVAVKLGIDRPLPLWRLLNQSSCSSSFCPFRLFRIKQIRVRRIAISVAPATLYGKCLFFPWLYRRGGNNLGLMVLYIRWQNDNGHQFGRVTFPDDWFANNGRPTVKIYTVG